MQLSLYVTPVGGCRNRVNSGFVAHFCYQRRILPALEQLGVLCKLIYQVFSYRRRERVFRSSRRDSLAAFIYTNCAVLYADYAVEMFI